MESGSYTPLMWQKSDGVQVGGHPLEIPVFTLTAAMLASVSDSCRRQHFLASKIPHSLVRGSWTAPHPSGEGKRLDIRRVGIEPY